MRVFSKLINGFYILITGASHADELQLLFPYDDYPYVPLDSEYATLSKTMVKLWVSFAADGYARHHSLSQLELVTLTIF